MRIPSLFVSHGLPPVALFADAYSEALQNFGATLPPLKGIVVLSSHWVTPGAIQITANPSPGISHHFYGYQKDLYDLNYCPPGSEDLAQNIAALLDEKNFEVTLNPEAKLDHGVWIPLLRIRPAADVPVIQVSLPMFVGPRVVMNLGHALSVLREQGILLIGSGSAAYNPSKIIWSAGAEQVNPKIIEFDQWLRNHFLEAQVEDLLQFDKIAPQVEFAHPTSANLLPFFFIMGTSLMGDRPGLVYQGFKYHTVSMLTLQLSDSIDLRPSIFQ